MIMDVVKSCAEDVNVNLAACNYVNNR